MAITLKRLLAELDQYAAPVPLDVLRPLLEDSRINLADVQRFVRFGRSCYRRNLMYSGRAYQALVLCWRSGQRSPIHDHHGSACGVRVLSGVATETTFETSDCGLIYASRTHKLSAGSISASFDADIHQMGNLEAPGNDLVTLHVYSPPLVAMRTYFLGNSVLGEDDNAVRAAIRSRAARLRGAADAVVAAYAPSAARKPPKRRRSPQPSGA